MLHFPLTRLSSCWLCINLLLQLWHFLAIFYDSAYQFHAIFQFRVVSRVFVAFEVQFLIDILKWSPGIFLILTLEYYLFYLQGVLRLVFFLQNVNYDNQNELSRTPYLPAFQFTWSLSYITKWFRTAEW